MQNKLIILEKRWKADYTEYGILGIISKYI